MFSLFYANNVQVLNKTCFEYYLWLAYLLLNKPKGMYSLSANSIISAKACKRLILISELHAFKIYDHLNVNIFGVYFIIRK